MPRRANPFRSIWWARPGYPIIESEEQKVDTMRIIANRKERGAALLIAMMALLLLAAIGVGFMFMADTENSVNNNYRDSQKAYFAARARLENVRVLRAPGGSLNTSALNLTMPS